MFEIEDKLPFTGQGMRKKNDHPRMLSCETLEQSSALFKISEI